MTQPASDPVVAYAHENARFIERRARQDLNATLERMAGCMERAATVFRRWASRNDISPAERVAWARHELGLIHADEDHLLGVGLVSEDARQELDDFDALLENEQTA